MKLEQMIILSICSSFCNYYNLLSISSVLIKNNVHKYKLKFDYKIWVHNLFETKPIEVIGLISCGH